MLLDWLKKLFLLDNNLTYYKNNSSVNFSGDDTEFFDDDCDTTDPASPCYDDPFDNFYDDYETDNTTCDPFDPTDPCYDDFWD